MPVVGNGVFAPRKCPLALARSEDLAVVGGQHPTHQGKPQIHTLAIFAPLLLVQQGVGNHGTDE